MAYFPDLTPYSYGISPQIGGAFPNALNVGWLDRAEPFPVDSAPLPESLLNRLLAHTALPVVLMRGIHQCHFCSYDPGDRSRLSVVRDGREIFLDNGEVLVVGAEGQAFRAPVMLYHYITVHAYRPPDAFLHALGESSPTMGVDLEEGDWGDSLLKIAASHRALLAERRAFALSLLRE